MRLETQLTRGSRLFMILRHFDARGISLIKHGLAVTIDSYWVGNDMPIYVGEVIRVTRWKR